jgi:hypothetical protein
MSPYIFPDPTNSAARPAPEFHILQTLLTKPPVDGKYRLGGM